MKVSIAGTGYVGLVSGVCLASLGHQVVCVDVDQSKVDKINAGIPPIYEDGLESLLKKHVGKELTASVDLHSAVLTSDLTLIAVGTPFDGDLIDLKYIRAVSAEIGTALAQKDSYHTVVVKSTVVPGTTEDVVLPILEEHSGKKAGTDFGVGMNPEFLKEGEAIKDFMYPDRIVLGGIDQRSIDALGELYTVFDKVDKIPTTPRTAEMIKYTANSLLATLISFSNEIGNLCAKVGDIDVTDVMAGVHLDKRLSPILENGQRITPSIVTYLAAGCGFGGSCFPKDVKALIAYGQQNKEPMGILDAVIDINAKQPMVMLDILRSHHADISGLNVAVLGLSFKPGSDDMRESPSIPIINALLDDGASVIAFDPVARHEAEQVLPADAMTFCDDLEDTISSADVIFIVTRWPEFDALPELIKKLPKAPLVVDGRRMLDKASIEHYDGVGL